MIKKDVSNVNSMCNWTFLLPYLLCGAWYCLTYIKKYFVNMLCLVSWYYYLLLFYLRKKYIFKMSVHVLLFTDVTLPRVEAVLLKEFPVVLTWVNNGYIIEQYTDSIPLQTVIMFCFVLSNAHSIIVLICLRPSTSSAKPRPFDDYVNVTTPPDRLYPRDRPRPRRLPRAPEPQGRRHHLPAASECSKW